MDIPVRPTAGYDARNIEEERKTVNPVTACRLAISSYLTVCWRAEMSMCLLQTDMCKVMLRCFRYV